MLNDAITRIFVQKQYTKQPSFYGLHCFPLKIDCLPCYTIFVFSFCCRCCFLRLQVLLIDHNASNRKLLRFSLHFKVERSKTFPIFRLFLKVYNQNCWQASEI